MIGAPADENLVEQSIVALKWWGLADSGDRASYSLGGHHNKKRKRRGSLGFNTFHGEFVPSVPHLYYSVWGRYPGIQEAREAAEEGWRLHLGAMIASQNDLKSALPRVRGTSPVEWEVVTRWGISSLSLTGGITITPVVAGGATTYFLCRDRGGGAWYENLDEAAAAALTTLALQITKYLESEKARTDREKARLTKENALSYAEKGWNRNTHSIKIAWRRGVGSPDDSRLVKQYISVGRNPSAPDAYTLSSGAGGYSVYETPDEARDAAYVVWQRQIDERGTTRGHLLEAATTWNAEGDSPGGVLVKWKVRKKWGAYQLVGARVEANDLPGGLDSLCAITQSSDAQYRATLISKDVQRTTERFAESLGDHSTMEGARAACMAKWNQLVENQERTRQELEAARVEFKLLTKLWNE